MPSLGNVVLSTTLLALAVVISVQLGQGRWWPTRQGGILGRVVLVGLNVFAMALIPVILGSLYTYPETDGYSQGYNQGFADSQGQGGRSDRAGIYSAGKWISQIYPYDASGKPLVGVQLFDQEGKPINLVTQTECVYDALDRWDRDHGRVYYPWTNGAAQQRNVVPVPSVVARPGVSDPDPLAFSRDVKPMIGQFPMTSVPAISLPGLATSTTRTPKDAFEPGVRPQQANKGIDEGCGGPAVRGLPGCAVLALGPPHPQPAPLDVQTQLMAQAQRDGLRRTVRPEPPHNLVDGVCRQLGQGRVDPFRLTPPPRQGHL